MMTAVSGYTERQARALTEQIRTATESLAAMLREAHEHRVWDSLGYRSWVEYIDTEFTISVSRSYRLLGAAKMEQQLSTAVRAEVTVTERSVRPLKAHLTAVGTQARKNVRRGMEPQEAVDEAIRTTRAQLPLPVTRAHFDDGTRGGAADDFDAGDAVYECRHCHRVEPLSRYILRRAADD